MPAEQILVVEDEAVVALDIEQGLRQLGYRVQGGAVTGEEAIHKATQFRPDLILMDIRLKGPMDGIEAAVRIRKEAEIPIIFLTAYADEPTLQRAKEAEPYAYLIKPFEERVLGTAIEIALHKNRTQNLLLRQLSEALRDSNARFHRLVDSIQDYAVILLDERGHIRHWNPGAENLFGYPSTAVLGKPFSMLYPMSSSAEQKTGEILEVAMREGRHWEPGWRMRQDGSRFWGEATLLYLQNQSKDPCCFLLVAREKLLAHAN